MSLKDRMDDPDFDLLVNWKGGFVSMFVWADFEKHVEDPRVVQEMLDLVQGGGEVLEVPPYLASLV